MKIKWNALSALKVCHRQKRLQHKENYKNVQNEFLIHLLSGVEKAENTVELADDIVLI